MFDWFKKILRKKEIDTLTSEYIFGDKKDKEVVPNCDDCVFKSYCKDKNNITMECNYVIDLKNFDEDKDAILLVDDHEGLISFLKDDFDFILDELNIDDLNIITISGKNAGFNFEAIFKKNPNLNIKYAVIDITLGGTRMTTNGIQKYTGVDIFEYIYKKNKQLKFLFYTGNNLNTYIKSNKKIVDQFYKITNKHIKQYVLFKTSMSIDDRRDKLIKMLFN
jgi:hypothetical protein